MDIEGGEEVVEAALIEFVALLFSPGEGEVGWRSVDGFGDVEQVLFAWKTSTIWMAAGRCSSAQFQIQGRRREDDLPGDSVEAAALGFANGAKGEGGGHGVGIAAGDSLDGGVVGDGVGVAHGRALGLAFHPLGLDVEPGQLAQQRAGFGEADPCGGEAGHAQGRRRQRGSSRASARSRGLKPVWQRWQCYQARSSSISPRAVVKVLGRRPA